MVTDFFKNKSVFSSPMATSSGQTWRIASGPWMEQHDLVKAQQYLGIKKVVGMSGLGLGIGFVRVFFNNFKIGGTSAISSIFLNSFWVH